MVGPWVHSPHPRLALPASGFCFLPLYLLLRVSQCLPPFLPCLLALFPMFCLCLLILMLWVLPVWICLCLLPSVVLSHTLQKSRVHLGGICLADLYRLRYFLWAALLIGPSLSLIPAQSWCHGLRVPAPPEQTEEPEPGLTRQLAGGGA